ncbi:bromodomain-containing protein DDB_G0270170 [Sergentomyia squamirostris]
MGQLFSVPDRKRDTTDVDVSEPSKRRRNFVIWVRMKRMEPAAEGGKSKAKKCTCPYERPTLKPTDELMMKSEEGASAGSFNNNGSTLICDRGRGEASAEDGQRTVINLINNNTASNITTTIQETTSHNDNDVNLSQRLSVINLTGATSKEVEAARECGHCMKKKNSGLKNKLCKLCRSHSCSLSMSTKEAKEKTKKPNWSLRFNCAKIKGSKTSPVVAEEKSSTCTCSNRKSREGRPVSSPPSITPEIVNVEATVARPASSPASVSTTAGPSNVILSTQSVQVLTPGQHMAAGGSTGASTSALLLPDSATFQSLSPPTTTTTTTVLRSNGQLIAHRIEHTAFYGSLPTAPGAGNLLVFMNQPQLLDFSRFNPDDYPTEDCDEQARLQREREIEEGVEAPPGFRPTEAATPPTAAPAVIPPTAPPSMVHWSPIGSTTIQSLLQANSRGATAPAAPSLYTLDDIHQHHQLALLQQPAPQRIHSQVDYIHCLVPDLQKITACSFYWGKMDRYQAEKLLDGKPEGTFLLRDSAQEDFLFSVSFRKYGRSLHARIEQFNHTFSFDSHDPGVFTANTVTGLLEHYKDPLCVMFFEPMLTLPLNRNFCFSLQQLCRAAIVSRITYDNISELCLPSSLKSYLKEYHYKQKVRVKRFDEYSTYDGETS